jgi:glycine dehydrogenase subunit 1
MIERIGVKSVDALFEQIPEPLRLNRELNLDPPLSEPELMAHLSNLAGYAPAGGKPSFLGAGAYRHHVSPVVDQLLLRSEFYTAYTPYQPEVSQGTLQTIFEFQTMVCRLFQMGFANASMYDGATAAAEAALMTRRAERGRSRILVSEGVHPEYIETIRTYLVGLDDGTPNLDIVPIDRATGATSLGALKDRLDEQTAAVIIGYPNFFGVVDDLDKAALLAADAGALTVSVTHEPVSLGTVAPPGALGADIAVGEGQPLGIPLSFGGPGLGLFAIREDKKLLRQMPGRLVGQTKDVNGKTGYVLTLSTREQHIRREKATSNICTNHGLMALAATIHLSLLGEAGLKAVSEACLAKAEYLKSGIAGIDGFSIAFSGPTFNELAVRAEGRSASDVLSKLDFMAGVDLGRFPLGMEDTFLVAVSELHTKKELDSFVSALRSL